ncbi:MAG: hypothetical protein IT440_11445 [Phycisphaeraceae bacterium]|nr:hypothetical protein [Phycisphaeraceae bacterium]
MRDAARDYFDESGVCLLSEGLTEGEARLAGRLNCQFFLREIVHCAMAYLHGNPDDVAMGNRILDQARLSSCDFSTTCLIKTVLSVGPRLTAKTRKKLRNHIAGQLTEIRKQHNSFVGCNDNFPAMATFIFSVGGELLNNRQAMQDGLDNLHSLADQLGRRGFMGEYNSPTYSGVTLHALSETASRVKHPQARRLAKELTHRVWLDVASHWHPGISFHAGPFSRAYHANSTAWDGLTSTVMWLALGDDIICGPLDRVFGPNAADSLETRSGNLPFAQAVFTGYAGTTYRIPDAIGELALRKRYPFRVTGTTECGTFHDGDFKLQANGAYVHIPGRSVDYGADASTTTTFMQPDYALGTVTKTFLGGGQCDACFAIWRRRHRVKQWSDVRSLFTRYLINDARPENDDNRGLLMHRGLTFTVQDDARALVLMHPAGTQRQQVHTLRLALVMQERTSPVDEIWFGDRRLPGHDGESATPDWVILRDGPVLVALYPLAPTDTGRKVLMRSGQENGYRVISFYNRQADEPRDYGIEESQVIQNGFVCEISTVRREGSARAFLRKLRQAEMVDSTILESRRVAYRRGGREMLLWIDPARQSIKAAAVNNRAVGGEPLKIDGVNLRDVPLLGRGPAGTSLDWLTRIASRPGIPGLEGVGGRRVEE